jgi:hypothetical protein
LLTRLPRSLSLELTPIHSARPLNRALLADLPIPVLPFLFPSAYGLLSLALQLAADQDLWRSLLDELGSTLDAIKSCLLTFRLAPFDQLTVLRRLLPTYPLINVSSPKASRFIPPCRLRFRERPAGLLGSVALAFPPAYGRGYAPSAYRSAFHRVPESLRSPLHRG